MLDHAAIESTPSRLAIVVGLLLTGLLAAVPIVRAPAPIVEPCPIMSSEDHARAAIQTRTRELNPRYLSRSRFGDPMLAR